MRTLPGALIVSSGEKGRDMLCGVLTDMGAGDISTVTSGAEARRGFADADWQVILINTPLSDEFGHELAVFAAGSTGAGVVLLVKAEMADEVAARVEDAGVFVVPKPLNRALCLGLSSWRRRRTAASWVCSGRTTSCSKRSTTFVWWTGRNAR